VLLYAFDLLELDGEDLRREPFETRKATLASLVRGSTSTCPSPGILCSGTPASSGLEGIVSKRLGSRYRSGRSPDWLKMKNPAAPTVKQAEEGWGR
jgi:bifunctional non-homologous end joining protein LigD